MLAKHGGAGLRRAFERHLSEFDPCQGRDPLHADMQRGAGTGCRVGDLAGILLGEVDHVLPGLEWSFGAGGDAERVASEIDDVGKVLRGIPGNLLHQGQTEHRDRYLRDGVAIRFSPCRHNGRADRAAAAGFVVNHNRLAKHL